MLPARWHAPGRAQRREHGGVEAVGAVIEVARHVQPRRRPNAHLVVVCGAHIGVERLPCTAQLAREVAEGAIVEHPIRLRLDEHEVSRLVLVVQPLALRSSCSHNRAPRAPLRPLPLLALPPPSVPRLLLVPCMRILHVRTPRTLTLTAARRAGRC
jgi:hypothetical protein